MKSQSILATIIVVLSSCVSPKTEAKISEETIHASHDLIVKHTFEYMFEDGPHIDDEYGSVQEFQKQTLKVEYLTDTILAHAMINVNSCGNTIPWIAINNDTIILTAKEQSKELCGSTSWIKYSYWISNPENKKYVILPED